MRKRLRKEAMRLVALQMLAAQTRLVAVATPTIVLPSLENVKIVRWSSKYCNFRAVKAALFRIGCF